MKLRGYFWQNIAEVKKYKLAYIFMLPAITLVILVSFYPIYYAFSQALYETRYMEVVKFVGLGNYLQFMRDPHGIRNILNSLLYVLGSLSLALPIGLVLALILNQDIKFRGLFRTIVIAPWVVSQTITALLWGWLLNPQYGPTNYYLRAFLKRSIDFLGDPNLAMGTLILTNVWMSYPLSMILILAALQAIPLELYEAARVDGASGWASFKHITIPLIQPTLLITMIMETLTYFNMVTLIYVLTGGGPVRKTETLSLRVFMEGFEFWHMGFATALGIVIFGFNVIFSLLYIKLLRREPYY